MNKSKVWLLYKILEIQKNKKKIEMSSNLNQYSPTVTMLLYILHVYSVCVCVVIHIFTGRICSQRTFFPALNLTYLRLWLCSF